MKIDLQGQVALVTGAARGIGRAIADAYAINGARVIYADIDLPTAQLSAQASGGIALGLDITDEAAVQHALAGIQKDYGKLDILVNNAGVNTLHNRLPIHEFSTAEWDRVLRVDLTGLFYMSRAASRIMTLQGSGRIINIASVVGLVPLRLQSPFVAAKAGVVNLTKSMAMELGAHGILVNGIAPGSVLTDATRQLFYGEDGSYKQAVQQLLDHIPLGRPGTAQEIAQGALYLADPDNSYMTGHILTVDGGWTAGYSRDF